MKPIKIRYYLFAIAMIYVVIHQWHFVMERVG